MERLDALAKQQDNQRSLHDRQMTEIRQAMAASARPASGMEDDGTDDEPQPKPGLTPGRVAEMRDRAIVEFKVNHPDWKEYWQDIEAIGGDSSKAKRFLRYKSDPDTGDLVPDFSTSLTDIREHVEMQRLRKQLEDANPANQQAARATNQAKADASAIGGAAASIPDDALEAFKTLPYNEKVKKLAEWGVIDVDPADPPEAFRKR